MKLLRRFDRCQYLRQGSVVTLGNYDGVHRGHQTLLKELIVQGHNRSLPTCVVTFEPMPSEFFGSDQGPGRLSTWRERYQQIKAIGIDVCCLLPFDAQLAKLQPEQFVTDYLLERLQVKLLYVGDDFRFGHKRAGTVDTLRAMGKLHGFEVAQLPTIAHKNERISSSAIRRCLLDADLSMAQTMLGRPYSMSGRVIHGQQLGRTLGYPTANILPRRNSLPMTGIFAVRVQSQQDMQWHDGVANLGFRPTVGGGDALLEAHLFDFDGDLYGQRLRIEFIQKLRDEEHFASLDLMVEQMHIDSAQAREVLSKIGS